MKIVGFCRDDEVDEWAIIELQGALEENETGEDNKYVGEVFYLKDNTPVMIIGNHILHGKEVVMEKPMGVLLKQQSEDEGKSNVEYKFQAIVKKKLLFKTRPTNLAARV